MASSPLQRLAAFGISGNYLGDLKPGLVRYVKDNKSLVSEIVSAVLPSDADVAEVVNERRLGSRKAQVRLNLREQYGESMDWLKWLMFEGDPDTALTELANLSRDQRGVCGAVWGKNDLAFRCRTCEHDPTCAICVPCFQNGNHKDHDYAIIYTGGGCCDCGDETAWKREGFCSKHKGSDQIVPLPDEIANSVGAVLDALFRYWRSKLVVAETRSSDDLSAHDRVLEPVKVANEFSYVVVEVLLDFCSHSESLLSFVSKRMVSIVDLLKMLVRAERFLSADVTKKLHELFLKLIGEPVFKYEFAKVFINYYRVPVAEVLKASSDNALKKFPLLPMFSVQIFTVPTLTPHLVKEWNLLAVLLECLGEILLYCFSEDGQLQFNKWVSVFDTCIRVIEDIRFVLSHSDVATYVTHERSDIVKAWLQILSLVQGMNPLKREMSIHIEEEIDNAHLPFIVCNCIANIHLLLVKGAFSASSLDDMDQEDSFQKTSVDRDDIFNQRLAKVGRLSEESSVCSSVSHSSTSGSVHQKIEGTILPSVLKMAFESVRAIDHWLVGSNVIASGVGGDLRSKILAVKEALLAVKEGKYGSQPIGGSMEMNENSGSTVIGSQPSCTDVSPSFYASWGSQQQQGKLNCPMATGDMQVDSIMEAEISTEKHVLSYFSLSEWPDIDYDVSSQEISLHTPLHGLLSIVLKEALRTYCSESLVIDTGGIGSENSLSSPHQFFQIFFKGCHPSGLSSFLMEHPLQNRVFCAQVHAGMWRRNGESALLCWECYRSIRWSDHQLELDIFLLQLCAAFAPADLYVKRLLERFQLSNYLALDLKRSSEYEPVLMQELLILIIQIVKERRFCALTASENLQRELICKLATGDATHSQLVKSLPRDLSKLEQLQEVLDRISQYSNPSGLNQGKYSLRAPYWRDLDLYHPCWNPRDLQVAEERYSRFCGVSALSAQLPKWTNVYKPLIGLARIATCQTVLQLIRAVVFYAVSTEKSTESRAPDGILITALHLLWLALDIFSFERKSGHLLAHDGDSFSSLSLATEEIGAEMQNESGRQSLLSLLVLLMRMHKKEFSDNFVEPGNLNLSSLVERLLKRFSELDSNCMLKLQHIAPEIVNVQGADAANLGPSSDSEKRKMKARERQSAILAKMRAEQSKFMATLKSTTDTGSDDSSVRKEGCTSEAAQDSEEIHVCCLCHDPNSKDPVSFLVLLQKSRLVNFVDRGPPSWDVACQADEGASSQSASEITNSQARGSNAVCLDKLSSSQLTQLVEGAVHEFASQAQPSELNAFLDYLQFLFPQQRRLNVRGKSIDKKNSIASSLESVEQGVFLSINEEMGSTTPDTVVDVNSSEDYATASRNQVSLLLGKYTASLSKDHKDSSGNSSSHRVESAGQFPSYDGFGPSDCDGVHVSSCGHAVHQGCLDLYLSSLKERFNRRMVFEGGQIVDPDQGEFLCPVCRRLANSTLPTVSGDPCQLWEPRMGSNISSGQSSGSLTASKNESGSLGLQSTLSMMRTAASVVSKDETLKALPSQRSGRMRPNLEPVFQVLSGMYFPGKHEVLSRSGRVSPSLLMWDTLKYSLVATEIASRYGKSTLTVRRGLSSLHSEFRSSGRFIMSLLLRIVQSIRSNNLPDLLLRFRGLQLFAASICSGITYGKCDGALGIEGNIACILEHTNSDAIFPDTQIWSRASDPVLIHDPFSTLMWVLYCLPFPFLSSQQCFLSLIHLFYGVSVSQAIFTYCSYTRCNANGFGFDDCLVSDIANLAGDSVIVNQCFVSKFVDPSCPIKEMIDSFTLPYLRRCSLLWKLLESSVSSPFPSMSDDLDKSLDISRSQEASSSNADELPELRNMFGIPPLDIVFKDGVLRSMVLKWYHHLVKESEDRGVVRALHSTLSIPFQLMRLPIVYQDLVQRYIKPQCPNCKVVQDEPALCLLCGRLCSPAWKPCCRESGCQAHALSCGAGTGVFLLIRKTSILLQRNARQAPWPSPYLDAFGEEDIDMKRGKPLFLNEERYAALTYMVASHGLDRSTKVLRQTTVGTFFLV